MIGETLGHYRVVEKLGAGGMGEVYLAHDEHLQRDVAVKVLPPGTLTDESARKRFRKEALALSKLSHPNIATVYDFDTHEGVDFLAMEFISGTALAEKLASGSLPEKEVIALGTQMAAALEEAHEHGIVHRDLKPGNIMVTPKGQVKVLDFGLARLVQPVGDAASTETAGDTGGAAGTLPYMAPEQLRSETVDARTDIHAAGAVLYEMSSGRRPFREATTPLMIDAILHQMPPAPRTLNPRISPRFEELILKCLDKDPGRRYQLVKELRVDLERLAAPTPQVAAPQRRRLPVRRVLAPALALAAVLALLVAFDVGGLRDRLSGGIGTPHIESLAVLPLENLSGDPSQEAFANGMTEALTAELSKIKALKKVISRTSMMQYKGTGKPITQIAGELGVDALIEGSAIREGDTVRITVQLIHGATDAHLWAESFDREYRNILALHSDVARAIAREVKAALTPAELAGFSKAPVVNPEAYNFFMRGSEYLWRRTTTEADTRTAIEMYERAVELDSGFAPAYAALSEAHGQMWRNYYDRSAERVARAKATADRALALQPDLSETHRALGLYYYWCESDYDRALQELALAQSTKPNDSRVLNSIGAILRSQGKLDRALASFIKSAELDPLSAMPVHAAAQTCTFLRDHEEADHYDGLAIKLAPDWPRPYGFRALCDLRLAGDAASAREVIETAQRIGLGNDPLIAYARAMVDLYDGSLQEAATRLPSEAWEVCESQFHFVPKALLQAQIHDLLNQPQPARSFYESARNFADAKARQLPDEAFFRGALGIAYAGLGRKQDAIREGKAAVDLLPVSKDAFRGLYVVEELARIHVMVGEYEAALDRLEYLMSIPGDLGAGALRLDPAWKPLRDHPRFQALIRRYGK